jgi:hypothetical protein
MVYHAPPSVNVSYWLEMEGYHNVEEKMLPREID